jgi:uncharacterized membrane protein
MYLTSYIFKSKAVRSLKGNWQTALIVSFIAALPSTVNAMLRSTQLPEVASYSYEDLLAASQQITMGTVWLLAAVGLMTFLVTPVLSVGCYNYFIRRLQGEELGIAGVLSRRTIFLRALWLYVFMAIRVLLWSLLFLIPGIVAALRYALAPYFLAENPELTAAEAINKSKAAMADKKFSLFLLLLSFIGWALMALAAQIMLISFSVILALVAYQFIELFRVTYMNASVSAFYLAASRTEGVAKAKQEADAFVESIQSQIPFGGIGRGDVKDETGDGKKDRDPDVDDPEDGKDDGEDKD